MIISRTPFRVSFFGGGTDFPEFYREHGGATLATGIDKYCYLSVHSLGPFFKHRLRVSYAQTETVRHASDIQHPLVRECLGLLGMDDGMQGDVREAHPIRVDAEMRIELAGDPLELPLRRCVHLASPPTGVDEHTSEIPQRGFGDLSQPSA